MNDYYQIALIITLVSVSLLVLSAFLLIPSVVIARRLFTRYSSIDDREPPAQDNPYREFWQEMVVPGWRLTREMWRSTKEVWPAMKPLMIILLFITFVCFGLMGLLVALMFATSTPPM